jgi:hypothetical protein
VPVRFISGVRPRGSPPELLASVVAFSGVVIWPGDLLEGNILAIDTPVYEDIEKVSSFVATMSSSLDVPLWRSNGVLRQDADRLVSQLGVRLLCMWRRKKFHDGLIFLVLLGCLHWILHPLCGSILPKLFACWIYLEGSAPVWQQCFKRVF